MSERAKVQSDSGLTWGKRMLVWSMHAICNLVKTSVVHCCPRKEGERDRREGKESVLRHIYDWWPDRRDVHIVCLLWEGGRGEEKWFGEMVGSLHQIDRRGSDPKQLATPGPTGLHNHGKQVVWKKIERSQKFILMEYGKNLFLTFVASSSTCIRLCQRGSESQCCS